MSEVLTPIAQCQADWENQGWVFVEMDEEFPNLEDSTTAIPGNG